MLSPDRTFQVIQHIVAGELASQRGLNRMELLAATSPEESLTDGQLAVDSIEILSLARAVNEFFELDRSGLDEWLLRRRSLGQWRDLVQKRLAEAGDGLSLGFRSGGTTGEPTITRLPWQHLQRETSELAAIVGSPLRIVCIAPLNHIYGFLWGASLSEELEVPLITGEQAQRAMITPETGDLVVGFPEWWRLLSGRSTTFPEGVTGVTSTAPCPAALIHQMLEQGLERMLEVYGSSETGGIGWRDRPGAPYRLLGHWQPEGADRLVSGAGVEATPPDRIRWHDDRHLEPIGRRDGAIQVGGTNVWPQKVREAIEEHPDVSECAVRPFETSSGTRLKAFVVPARDGTEAEHTLKQWFREQLPAPERPVRLDLGTELPRNEMGKLSDW